MNRLKAGTLFSGIGAADLGLQRAGIEISWQCEQDLFCKSILDKNFPGIKKYGDIHDVTEPEAVDIIFGSPPCQPYSLAGKRAGSEDDRALWPEMFRVVQAVRPAWVICENVPGIINLDLDQMLSDLESAGFECQTFIVPACGVDAPHKRDRVWIVAYSDSNGKSSSTFNDRKIGLCENSLPDSGHGPRRKKRVAIQRKDAQKIRSCCASEAGGSDQQSGITADNDCKHENHGRFRASKIQRVRKPSRISGCEFWPPESGIHRVDDGPAPGVDKSRHTKIRNKRLHALGNALVPQIVERIGRFIIEAEKE